MVIGVSKEASATGTRAEATRSDAIGAARVGSIRLNPVVNKFNGSGQMTDTHDTDDTDDTNETDGANNYPDVAGLAGTAVEVTRSTGEREPGIVRGSYDVTRGAETVATRVLVDADTSDELLDTAAPRVEVM